VPLLSIRYNHRPRLLGMAMKNSALMKKLIVTIFSLYFILAIVVSAVHIAFEYKYIRDQIYVDLRSIYVSSSDSLSTAIWNFNTEQVEKLLDGLLTLSVVSGVKLYQNADGLNASKGNVDDDTAISFDGLIIYSNDNKGHNMGRIRFYASQNFIFERIKVNVIFIIINAFIKTLFLSAIMLFAGYRLIGKPLNQLSESVHRLDFEDAEHIKNSKVTLDKHVFKHKNELTELIIAYNKTLDKLLRRTEQRDEARKTLEQENINLERLVDIKTLALQDKVNELNDANTNLSILASTDFLTELLNRRYFFERAEAELNRSKRNQQNLAILIVDIDHFKNVNDQHGHLAGAHVGH
jgi:hypothetical protein